VDNLSKIDRVKPRSCERVTPVVFQQLMDCQKKEGHQQAVLTQNLLTDIMTFIA